jgi:isopentenyldiphosphate isomerase
MADEYFDVVNEDNVVVRQELRSIVHRTGLWHRGMNIFLFTRDGKLLVQKRSRDKDTFPSALDCSVSEHVKAGEEYAQTAERGLREELGVEGIELRPLIEFSMIYGTNDNEISQLFEGIIDPNAVHRDPVEIEQISYHALDELLDMINTHAVSFSRWFEQLVLWYCDGSSDVHIRKIFNPKALGIYKTTGAL